MAGQIPLLLSRSGSTVTIEPYILDEFYQNRCQTETLIEELRLMQDVHGEGKIFCDRSEPQTIDMFRRAGLNAGADASKREEGIHELGGRFDGASRWKTTLVCAI